VKRCKSEITRDNNVEIMQCTCTLTINSSFVGRQKILNFRYVLVSLSRIIFMCV
jgi:hypothetical protein